MQSSPHVTSFTAVGNEDGQERSVRINRGRNAILVPVPGTSVAAPLPSHSGGRRQIGSFRWRKRILFPENTRYRQFHRQHHHSSNNALNGRHGLCDRDLNYLSRHSFDSVQVGSPHIFQLYTPEIRGIPSLGEDSEASLQGVKKEEQGSTFGG
jgi:hypothetical protein